MNTRDMLQKNNTPHCCGGRPEPDRSVRLARAPAKQVPAATSMFSLLPRDNVTTPGIRIQRSVASDSPLIGYLSTPQQRYVSRWVD